MCAAIQRALLFAGRKILQTYQLHQPMASDAWSILHQLYLLAEFQQMVDIPTNAPVDASRTIKATYAQAVALSCCKPNQLRQNDLTSLYMALQDWGEKVQIESRENGNELFLVDLNSDQPAQFRALYRQNSDAELRAIDTGGLLRFIQSLKDELVGKGATFDKNTGIPMLMLDHLIASLGSLSMRNYKRTASNSPLWICVGLGSTHYQINQQQLQQQLHATAAASLA